MMPNTRAAIEYFVKRLSEAGTSPTRTRVMKLVYLADVAFYREQGSQFTDLRWRFLHYGPYAAEVTEELEQLAAEGLTSRTTDEEEAGEETFVAYWQRSTDLAAGVRDRVGLQGVLLLQDVYRAWGEAELNRLLDHVYFDTEPMTNAKRYACLDFTTVRPRQEEGWDVVDDAEIARTERLADGLRALAQAGREEPTISVLHDLGDFDFSPEGATRLSLDALRGKCITMPDGAIERLARSFGKTMPK